MAGPRTQRKWREARYFLAALNAHSAKATQTDAEEFGFIASAFLTAARSVTDVACKEHPRTFTRTYETWKSSLDPEMLATHTFIDKRRSRAVHHGEASAQHAFESRPAVHVYSPAIAPWVFDDGATVDVSVYSIQIDGESRPMLPLLSRYLDELGKFVDVLDG
jgi:hypothetical protein